MRSENTETQVREGLARLASEAPKATEVWWRVNAAVSKEREGLQQPPNEPAGRGRFRSVAAMVAVACSVAGVVVGLGAYDLRPANDSQQAANPDAGPRERIQAMHKSVEVGRGSAVLSVPEVWQRGASKCGVPTANTVAFESAATRACAMPASDYDSVTIGWIAGHDTDGMPNRLIEGRIVYVSEPTVTSTGLTAVEILVPSEDARFSIETKNRELAMAIVDSLRFLPGDQTTVPDLYQGATGGVEGISASPSPAEVRTRLERAGLALQVRFVGAATASQWSALSADAEPGTIVPRGAVVTVTYSLGDKAP